MDIEDSNLDVFVQATRASMLFSFPGPSVRGTNNEDLDTHGYVTRLMQRQFLKSSHPGGQAILVDRPEIDHLASNLRSHRLCTLVGERGSGKSTILFGALSQLGALSKEFLSDYGIDEQHLVNHGALSSSLRPPRGALLDHHSASIPQSSQS